jgi:hypothetical protein
VLEAEELGQLYTASGPEKKKCHEYGTKGIASFQRFLDLFRDQQGAMPDTIDSDNLPSVLQAHFNMARCLARRSRFADPALRVPDMVQSMEKYKWLVAFSEKNIPEVRDDIRERRDDTTKKQFVKTFTLFLGRLKGCLD